MNIKTSSGDLYYYGRTNCQPFYNIVFFFFSKPKFRQDNSFFFFFFLTSDYFLDGGLEAHNRKKLFQRLRMLVVVAVPVPSLFRVLVILVDGCWVRSSSRCFPLTFEASFSFSFSDSWGFQSRNFLREALLPFSAYSARVTTCWANPAWLTNWYAEWYASMMGLKQSFFFFKKKKKGLRKGKKEQKGKKGRKRSYWKRRRREGKRREGGVRV